LLPATRTARARTFSWNTSSAIQGDKAADRNLQDMAIQASGSGFLGLKGLGTSPPAAVEHLMGESV
jgi:hypothetical protein